MISEVAIAIQNSAEMPDEILDILNQHFVAHGRKSIMNGEYRVYHADYIKGEAYELVMDKILPWLRTLPFRFDDDQNLIEMYQMVIYTAENEHQVQSYGYEWFEINLGLIY
jgi:hypothetical protein